MAALNPEPAPPARRRFEREGTPGRCSNLDYCSIGMQRVLVQVPVGQPFNCPECGGRLRPPAESLTGRPWVMPAVRILVLLTGIGLGGLQGYLIGRAKPAGRAAVPAMSKDAEIRLNTAREMLGLPKLQAGAVAAAAPAPPVVAATPAPAPPPPPVREQPYPERPVPLDTADPPLHLQNEQRYGQVAVDCLLLAGHGKPSCHVGDIRGSDAFSAAALDWLQSLAVPYPATQPDHRWRVIFEDDTGTATDSPPPAPGHPPRKHRRHR